MAATGCGKDKQPPASTSSTASVKTQPRNEACGKNIQILDQAGIEKVKAGLDKVVARITEDDADALVFGAKIYRRGIPSRYSEKEISEASLHAINALNRIGELLASEKLVNNAPLLKLGTGTLLEKTFAYPAPPTERDRNNISFRDKYDGIPYFGLSAGENVADAGFALIGEVNTKIDSVNYLVSLVYTAVSKNYVLKARGYLDNLKSVPFDISSCASDEKIEKWIAMPRVQLNFNECEFGGCRNLPSN
jgi:hypothetical protein